MTITGVAPASMASSCRNLARASTDRERGRSPSKHGILAAMTDRRILVLCPDTDVPAGGVKQLYRHVDVLSEAGYEASIVHARPGFRCRWFENETPVAFAPALAPILRPPVREKRIRRFLLGPRGNPFWLANALRRKLLGKDRAAPLDPAVKEIAVRREDVLGIPEVHAPWAARLAPGTPKVMLNQNPFYTFLGQGFEAPDPGLAYTHPETVAAITFSVYNREYLGWLFPDLPLHAVRYGFDPETFAFSPDKRRRIALMPRKCREDAEELIAVLRSRGTLAGFEVEVVDGKPESAVAEALGSAALFLSFGQREGFGMPVAEALARGCAVIGYDGVGGRELFEDGRATAVAHGDLGAFARAVEAFIETWDADPAAAIERARARSDAVLDEYSLENETADIRRAWESITARL
jgi:glycosyltransferase involved in cell wall biosynthesis